MGAQITLGGNAPGGALQRLYGRVLVLGESGALLTDAVGRLHAVTHSRAHAGVGQPDPELSRRRTRAASPGYRFQLEWDRKRADSRAERAPRSVSPFAHVEPRASASGRARPAAADRGRAGFDGGAVADHQRQPRNRASDRHRQCGWPRSGRVGGGLPCRCLRSSSRPVSRWAARFCASRAGSTETRAARRSRRSSTRTETSRPARRPPSRARLPPQARWRQPCLRPPPRRSRRARWPRSLVTPNNGEELEVAASDTANAVIYGTQNAIFRSTNGGKTVSPSTLNYAIPPGAGGFLNPLGDPTVAVGAPNASGNQAFWYMQIEQSGTVPLPLAVGSSSFFAALGLYKSTDNGLTAQRCPPGVPGRLYGRVEQVPDNGSAAHRRGPRQPGKLYDQCQRSLRSDLRCMAKFRKSEHRNHRHRVLDRRDQLEHQPHGFMRWAGVTSRESMWRPTGRCSWPPASAATTTRISSRSTSSRPASNKMTPLTTSGFPSQHSAAGPQRGHLGRVRPARSRSRPHVELHDRGRYERLDGPADLRHVRERDGSG